MKNDVDYRIRPKKAAERIMLSKALQRIQMFSKVEDYSYIGFGALFYVDFKLFYKELGIKSMLSIEGDTNTSDRYKFNKPFDFVDFKPGFSYDVLPKLDLTKKSIVWLDYTGGLCEKKLSDITTLVENLPAFSVIFITLNHYIRPQVDSDNVFRELEKAVGKARISEESVDDMCTDYMPNVYRRIINNEISTTVSRRNTINIEKIDFFNLCSLKYSDNANMMTCGFVLTPRGKKMKIKSAFKGISYLMTSGFYDLDFPMMTLKERIIFESERGEIEKKKLFTEVQLNLFEMHNAYIPYYTEAIF